MMKNILVTGGAGFIGSNFLSIMVKKHPSYNFVNLDLLTYAGDLKNLEEIDSCENYNFVKGDISDRAFVQGIFDEFDINGVVHFAAESHVDNSISDPECFIRTNIVGTFNLLDIAKKKWISTPGQYIEKYKNSRFLHVSTDEVYGSLGEVGFFTENTPYAPNSPYSASKASSDMLARSYFHTYGLDVVTTNCSNNYGPRQHEEKLIPTIIRKALKGDQIPIYGTGENIRDWLYVDDHCHGIELAFTQGVSGETYNIGGNNERTNVEIANTICSVLDEKKPRSSGSYKNLIAFVKDRPGHDFRYAIDASKITNELKWKQSENFDSGIIKTIDWYLSKSETGES